MKTALKNGLFLIITVAFLAACTGPKSQSADELLKDPEMREEIMTAICNDHGMMTNMMDHMMKSDHAMQMMGGNKAMMDTMMRHMMKMMQSDSTMHRRLREMMMNDEHTRGMMMDMMKENESDHEDDH